MRRFMMKSKIHRATVTEANLDYVGSITIDVALMERADLLPNEKVQVVDIDNGARLETYVIPGEAGSGVIGLNGAAARLVHPGDKVIVISYGEFEEAEAREHEPVVLFVDEDNRPVRHVVEVAGTPAQPDVAGTPAQPDVAGTPAQPGVAGTPAGPDVAGTSGRAGV